MKNALAITFLTIAFGQTGVSGPNPWLSQPAMEDSVFVRNVHFSVESGLVSILYDLVVAPAAADGENISEMIASLSEPSKRGGVKTSADDADSRLYEVEVILRRESDPNFRYEPVHTSGDVGVGLKAGLGRTIVWDITKEFPRGVEGSDYFFEVLAQEYAEPNDDALLWVVRAVAILGGGALTYAVLAGSKPERNAGGFPRPPGRPD